MRARSITLQLTLLFAMSSTFILLAVGAVLGVLVNEHFVMLDVDKLRMRIAQVDVARVPAGSVVNATPEVTIPASIGGSISPVTWKEAGRSFRGIATRVTGASGGDVTVVAAADISHHAAFMGVLWKILGFSIAVGVASSIVLGWIAARSGTAPIRRITRLAAGVSAERLGERLPSEGLPAELFPLSRAFNEMLSRLEDSFGRLSVFSADLAHELRTPITNVMTQTQVALSNARTAEEYREVLYSNLEEFQHLSRIVEDMLYLAKSEHSLELPGRVPVDIRREAEALAEFFEALASERGVRIECNGQGLALGDSLMVRRALANLLSNALRHSAAGSSIDVRVSSASGNVEAAVENRGPDIAPVHLPRLFDRFYRVDRSRGRGDGGSGLGLAITKAIAEAHGGAIRVQSGGGLTRFALTLPVAGTSDDSDVMKPSSSRQRPAATMKAAIPPNPRKEIT